MLRLLAAGCLTLAITSTLPAADKTFVPDVRMNDQFAKPHDVADLRGEVVVLVFADRGGAEASRDLGAKLHVHFHPQAKDKTAKESAKAPAIAIPGVPPDAKSPDAKMIPIAVIGEVPSALHIMVRTRFRQVAPDAPIWLDMTDSMRKQFDVKKDVPNFAVLDTAGRVRYSTSGKLDDKQFTELVDVIQSLRAEGVRASISRR